MFFYHPLHRSIHAAADSLKSSHSKLEKKSMQSYAYIINKTYEIFIVSLLIPHSQAHCTPFHILIQPLFSEKLIFSYFPVQM